MRWQLHHDSKKAWIFALTINGFIFLLFFIFFYPIYNSSEDAHALYLLAGGYGNPPTEFLHYNYGLHPFLNWLIKDLFLLNDKVNWYTIALVFAHYVFCTVILAYILDKRRTLTAYLSYAVLFIIFPGYFLLYPDFTGASIALTAAGLLYLLTTSWSGMLRYRHCLLASFLLLLASFYRIHSMIPLAGIALPFFALTLSPQAKRRAFVTLFISSLFILLFNRVHQVIYKTIKPDWATEESYRQKTYRFFNEQGSLRNPVPGEKWYEEFTMVTQGRIIDTSYMPSSLLDIMYHDLKKKGNLNRQLPVGWKKWFLINNRLFLLVTLLFIILYGSKKQILIPLLSSLVLLAAGLAYLLFRAKTPPYILVSGLGFISFTIFLYSEQKQFVVKKVYDIAKMVILSGFLVWGIIHLYRASNQNKAENYTFKQVYANLGSHPGYLFVCLDNLYLHKFYVFDVPSSFPLANSLAGDIFADEQYYPTLNRFGIKSTKDIFFSNKVLFYGEQSETERIYFEKIAGQSLMFSPALPGFPYGKVWRIIR